MTLVAKALLAPAPALYRMNRRQIPQIDFASRNGNPGK
jgi:hypothetical protein